ncbi:MAG: hypothetical protein PHU85_19580 [Phycisphaerae bacterium]|nr:hypothetical protein [Phycisphaerae bacterium]
MPRERVKPVPAADPDGIPMSLEARIRQGAGTDPQNGGETVAADPQVAVQQPPLPPAPAAAAAPVRGSTLFRTSTPPQAAVPQPPPASMLVWSEAEVQQEKHNSFVLGNWDIALIAAQEELVKNGHSVLANLLVEIRVHLGLLEPPTDQPPGGSPPQG